MKTNLAYQPTKFIMLIAMLVFFSGCSPILRNYVNRKYPPVSSVEKSIQSVKEAKERLGQLEQVDLGAKLSRSFLDSTLQRYITSLLKTSPNLGIDGVDSVQLTSRPIFSLGMQELQIQADFKFFISPTVKYVKTVDITFSGRLSPSVIADSLILRPSFQRVHINELKLRKWLYLGKAAKLAVNALCLRFMDNLNGQIKDLNLKIDYPPFPELPISQVLGSVENLRVTDDHVFKIERKMLDPVILINKENVMVVAAIADNPAETAEKGALALASISLPTLMPGLKYRISGKGAQKLESADIALKSASKGPKENPLAELKRLHGALDSAFNNAWNTQLDSLDRFDPLSSGVHLSYEAMGRITDEFFDQTKFAIDYKVDIKKALGPHKISLGDIEKPNCSHISFACDLRNCSSEMKDCDFDCKWYQVDCHAREVACHALNGVRYGACQVSNGLRVTWCATELAAKKALCYSTVAAIFLYDNLIKEVGRFDGDAKASGMVTVAIDRSVPGGLSSVGFRGKVQTDINGEVNFSFIPTSLVGLMACSMPAIAAFKLDHIKLSNSALVLDTKISKLTQDGMPLLQVRLEKMTLPIQLQQPFIAQILGRSTLVMSCGVGILAGLSYLKFFENDKFKQFLDFALKGSYKLEIEQDFSIKLPPLELGVLEYPLSLRPSWGTKSLMYTNLKN